MANIKRSIIKVLDDKSYKLIDPVTVAKNAASILLSSVKKVQDFLQSQYGITHLYFKDKLFLRAFSIKIIRFLIDQGELNILDKKLTSQKVLKSMFETLESKFLDQCVFEATANRLLSLKGRLAIFSLSNTPEILDKKFEEIKILSNKISYKLNLAIKKGEIDQGAIYIESFSRDLGAQLYLRGYSYSAISQGEAAKEIEEKISFRVASNRVKPIMVDFED